MSGSIWDEVNVMSVSRVIYSDLWTLRWDERANVVYWLPDTMRSLQCIISWYNAREAREYIAYVFILFISTICTPTYSLAGRLFFPIISFASDFAYSSPVATYISSQPAKVNLLPLHCSSVLKFLLCVLFGPRLWIQSCVTAEITLGAQKSALMW